MYELRTSAYRKVLLCPFRRRLRADGPEAFCGEHSSPLHRLAYVKPSPEIFSSTMLICEPA